MGGPLGEEKGEKPASGTDLEHAIVGSDVQRLQESALDPRGQHHLPVTDGHRDVGIGEAPVFFGHERVARGALHQVEHGPIEHLPRADLLLDHVEARTLEVHRRPCPCCTRC